VRRRCGLALALAASAALIAPSAGLAAFPGTNGNIVYDLSSPLFAVAPNGTGQIQLTSSTGYSATDPSVSANGNEIVFHRSGGPGYGIWQVRADGTGAHQVTVDPQAVAANDTDPTWSPDGSRIAFIRNSDVFVMNADGSGSTNLTTGLAASADMPAWSPDGSQIAFLASNQIWLVAPGGTPGPTQLTTGSIGNRGGPSWSPDGSRLAYGVGPASVGSIWTVNRNGSGEARLVGGLVEVWEISWSPDGTKIGFIQDTGTNPAVQEELFTVNADGTGVTQLNVDTDISMDWGPLASLAPPAPVLGKAVNVDVVKGTVLVAVPARGARGRGARASQKGLKFVPLEEARQIPTGSFLDTSRGTVSLKSATGAGSKTQSGQFTSGIFQVFQSRKKRDKGLTELRVKGGSFSRCRSSRGGKRASASALSKATIRKLKANAKGRFRTRGRRSAATVRGTIWITADRCDGTLTTVKRGRVEVRDFRRKKTVIVRAGKSYLAR
jgi:hypothetical protein